MIHGGHFPPSAVESGLASLVSGLNARHPGYRWQVLPLDPAKRRWATPSRSESLNGSAGACSPTRNPSTPSASDPHNPKESE